MSLASSRVRGIAANALLLVVGLTPLVYSLYGLDVFRLPKEIFFQAGMLVVGALTLVAWALGRWRMTPWRTEVALVAAAVAWAGVVTMTALNRDVAYFAPFTVFCYGTLFVSALLLLDGNRLLGLGAMLAPALLNAGVVILQALKVWTPFPEVATGPDKLANIGFLGNPNYVGAYLVVPCVAAIAAAVAYRGTLRAIFGVTAVLLIGGLLAAQSVTALAALAVGIAALIVTSGSRTLRLVAVAGLVLLIAAALAYRPTRERAYDLISAISSGRWIDVSSERLPPFGVALTMFGERPLLGVGPGGFASKYMPYKLAGEERHPDWSYVEKNTNYGEVHNDHLQLLAEGGIVAWLLFAALLWRVARQSWRSEDSFVRRFAFPGALAFAVLALAQFPMELAASASTAVFAAALCFTEGAEPEDDRARPGAVVLAVIGCVLAVVAANRLCLARYRCNVEKKTLQARLDTAFGLSLDWQRREAGRDAAVRLSRCIAVDPSDYIAWFLQGQAYQAAELKDDAMRSYRASLALSERPETWANIGVLQFEQGKPDLAYQSLLRAATFSQSYSFQTDSNLQSKIDEEVRARRERLRARAGGNSNHKS